MGISNNAATLLAAASVIALSVGMEPALADNQNNGVLIGLSKQDKGDANQLKLHSQQIKQNSSQLKLDSNHIKMDSQQYKQNSQQLKLDSNHIKMDSHQIKGSSMQQKGNPHALNPQPEPPG